MVEIAQYLGWGLLALFVIIIAVIGILLFKDKKDAPATEKPTVKKEKTPKVSKKKEKTLDSIEDGDDILSLGNKPVATNKPGSFAVEGVEQERPVVQPVPQPTPVVEPQISKPSVPVIPGLPSRPSRPTTTTPPAPKGLPNRPAGGPPQLNETTPNKFTP